MQKRYWTAIAVAIVIGVLGSVNIGGKELFTSTVVQAAEESGTILQVSMSISVAYDDLFDYNKGIYVKGKVFDEAFSAYKDSIREWEIVDISRKIEANYNQRGSEWERDAHIDYLESDGINTVCRLQQDCGIRIQGNYSRSDLQKGFRLYARNE